MVKKIGRYDVQGELAQGGFGRVYRGYDPSVGRPVAIKVLTSQGDPDMLTRFRLEASAAGKLQHKNIVTIFEYGQHNETPFIAMEFLEGNTLQEIIARKTPLSVPEKIGIMSQVAEGLHCAHRNGLVHRDVKPANIMVLPDGTVKIMDFGIARFARDTSHLTQTGFVVGTLQYMAPEQLTTSKADPRTDIFSYGAIYYEFLTWVHPFAGGDAAAVMYKIMSMDPAPIRSYAPDCPEALQKVVFRALAKDPEARYQSLEDLDLDAREIQIELRRQNAEDLLSEVARLFAVGELDSARSEIRKIVDLDPSNRKARELRTAIDTEVRRRDARSRVDALLRKAQEQIAQRTFPAAIESLETALRIDNQDTAARALLQRARSLEEGARRATELLKVAQHEYQSGHLTAAFRNASDALNLDPEKQEAKALMDQVQAAIERRERDRRLNDALQKIDQQLLLGDWAEARALLDNVEREAPEHPKIKELASRIEILKSESERSQQLAAGMAEAKNLLKNDRFEDALARLSRLRQQFPESQDVARLVEHAEGGVNARARRDSIERLREEAGKLAASGEYERAIRFLEEGIRRFAADGELAGALQSIIAAKAGSERKRRIEEALSQAGALEGQGNLAGAVRLLENVSRAEGDDGQVREGLKRIRAELEEQNKKAAIRSAAARADELIGQASYEAATMILQQARTEHSNAPELEALLTRAARGLDEQRRREAIARAAEEGRRLAEAGDLGRAMGVVEQGLRTFPEEKQLLALREHIARRQEARAREEAIAAAITECERLRRAGDLRQALSRAEAYAARYPGDETLTAMRQQLSQELGAEQRREEIKRICSQGAMLRQQGNVDEAVRVLERAAEQYAGADGSGLLAQQLEAARADRKQREDIRSVLARAAERVRSTDLDGALRELEEGRRQYPASTEITDAAARLRSSMQERERQAELADRVKAIKQRIGQRRWEEAIALIEIAQQRFPEEGALAEMLRGATADRDRERLKETIAGVRAHWDAGELGKAGEVLAGGLKLFPGDADLLTLRDELELHRIQNSLDRAKALIERNELDEAEREVREVLARRPHSGDATALIAIIEGRRAEREREATIQRRALQAGKRRSRPGVFIIAAAAIAAVVAGVLLLPKRNATPNKTPQPPARPVLAISTTRLPNGRAGMPYNEVLQSSGAAGSVRWSLLDGSLPRGLMLDANSGAVAGTPTGAGSSNFTVRAEGPGGAAAQQALAVIIEPAAEIARETQKPVDKKPVERKPVEEKPVEKKVVADADRANLPKPSPPVVTPPVEAAKPCAAKKFELASYGDITAGTLSWSGQLPAAGELAILKRSSTPYGAMRGDPLPNAPVRVAVSPATVRVKEGPSAANCWNPRLTLVNTGGPVSSITIDWKVFQP